MSFVGGNGVNKVVVVVSRIVLMGSLSNGGYLSFINNDGKGVYIIFNVGDILYISDLNS